MCTPAKNVICHEWPRIAMNCQAIQIRIQNQAKRARRLGLVAFLEFILNVGGFPFPVLFLPSHPLQDCRGLARRVASGNASRWAATPKELFHEWLRTN
jgi:hypothetical protein